MGPLRRVSDLGQAPHDAERHRVRDVLGLGDGRQDRLRHEPVERLHGRVASGRDGRRRHDGFRLFRQRPFRNHGLLLFRRRRLQRQDRRSPPCDDERPEQPRHRLRHHRRSFGFGETIRGGRPGNLVLRVDVGPRDRRLQLLLPDRPEELRRIPGMGRADAQQHDRPGPLLLGRNGRKRLREPDALDRARGKEPVAQDRLLLEVRRNLCHLPGRREQAHGRSQEQGRGRAGGAEPLARRSPPERLRQGRPRTQRRPRRGPTPRLRSGRQLGRRRLRDAERRVLPGRVRRGGAPREAGARRGAVRRIGSDFQRRRDGDGLQARRGGNGRDGQRGGVRVGHLRLDGVDHVVFRHGRGHAPARRHRARPLHDLLCARGREQQQGQVRHDARRFVQDEAGRVRLVGQDRPRPRGLRRAHARRRDRLLALARGGSGPPLPRVSRRLVQG